MEQILMFSFVVIMICCALMCVYGVWLATILTIEKIKEFIDDGTITSPFLIKLWKRRNENE